MQQYGQYTNSYADVSASPRLLLHATEYVRDVHHMRAYVNVRRMRACRAAFQFCQVSVQRFFRF